MRHCIRIPAEDEYVARYCARVGRREGIEAFHLAFSMFRFAVIFEGIAQRARIGTAASADAARVGRLSVAFARHACALIDR
jgi:aminoglycoside phosphotransferase (APT) family kinase protein